MQPALRSARGSPGGELLHSGADQLLSFLKGWTASSQGDTRLLMGLIAM